MAIGVAGLQGCVTMQGGSAFPTLPPINLEVSDLTDALSSRMRQVKKLVEDGKLEEAHTYFIAEQTYFAKRFKDGKSMPREVGTLTDFVWTKSFKPDVDATMRALLAVQSVEDKAQWPAIARLLAEVSRIRMGIATETLLQVSKVGFMERDALEFQRKRITDLAMAYRQTALQTTFEDTLALGRHPAAYVGADFGVSDYQVSPPFQELARKQVLASTDKTDYLKRAQALAAYLSTDSKQVLDRGYAELIRAEILADGQVTLDEMATLGAIATPFGGERRSLVSLVKMAHVNLSDVGGRNRGLEFPIAFAADLDVEMVPTSEAVLVGGEIAKFDYVLVTEPRMARIAREFRSKREQPSRVQTGTRQVPNPGYVQAISNHQKAMAEFQSAQISGAMPKFCRGLGCALQGLADGLSEGAARSNVDRAATLLSQTPQTLGEPVYEPYTYQSVDISTSKATEFGYYVIDVKRKRIYRNSSRTVDTQVFNVAYNVRDTDPDKGSIMRGTKSEEEVTAWEKYPFPVSLRNLFSTENLRAAAQTPFTDLRTFMKSLDSRIELAAAPARRAGPVAQEKSTGTIADERFDSIVILKNSRASGTGFYVAPDLILTTYHVVQGSKLVEIAFYDGRKTNGQVIDHDVRLDLALVKAQVTGKPMAIHAGSIKLGETVEAIGHPKGYDFTITRGVISALRKQRSVNIGSNDLVEFVQTDTPISQGNSGGPLLLKDAVIGVNDWTRVDKGSQNLNFSVSFNEVRAYLDRFLAREPGRVAESPSR